MEFFHAELYWNGYGQIITNVAGMAGTDGGEITDLNGEYAILQIFLKASETLKLRQYLEREFGKTIHEDEFEQYMRAAFYLEIPLLDKWFDLKKFIQICDRLQIRPKMFYHRYEQIRSDNNR